MTESQLLSKIKILEKENRILKEQIKFSSENFWYSFVHKKDEENFFDAVEEFLNERTIDMGRKVYFPKFRDSYLRGSIERQIAFAKYVNRNNCFPEVNGVVFYENVADFIEFVAEKKNKDAILCFESGTIEHLATKLGLISQETKKYYYSLFEKK